MQPLDLAARRLAIGALAVVAALCLALAASPAAPQGFADYGLIGERPAPEPDRAPDLQAYGEIAETYRAASALDATQRGIGRAREGVRALAERAPLIGADIRATLAAASPTGEPSYFLGLFAFLVLLIGIGRAAARVYGVYVARPVFVRLQRAVAAGPGPLGFSDKAPVLAARLAMTVVGLGLTMAVALLVGAGFYPEDNEAAVRTAIIAFGAYATMTLVDTFWRMACAPFLPEFRLSGLSDRASRRLYRWLYAATLAAVLSIAGVMWLDALGLPRETSALLRMGLLIAQIGLIGAGAWVNRAAIRSMLLQGASPQEATWPALLAATLWGPALTLFLIAGFVALAQRAIFGQDMGLPTIGVLFGVLLAGLTAHWTALYVIDRIARRARSPIRPVEPFAPAAPAGDAVGGADGDGDDGDGDGGGPAQALHAHASAPVVAPGPQLPSRRRMRSFEDLARRMASLLAFGAALWALTVLLGGRPLFQEGMPLDLAQDVIDIALIGYFLFHAARIWIDRRIAEEGADVEVMAEPGDEGGAAAASSRLATLLPLARNAVLILIGASVAILVAMELGVNVAPLLGGAGVIGLAIGFGSQTLIRDILSGAFFLFDDAFRKGEYIDVGEVKGTVEKISLRSFQLRHHLGALHTIPFGEIKHLTNFSRDWVMMKLPLRLTYDTDPEKVRKLIKKLGERLLEHPVEGHKFLQPLKSQGVFMMEDSAMIIRVKYMTRPGDQWTTRKLVYSEIRELFEREGIHFAHKEVTVRIPDLKGRDAQGLTEAEVRAIGAAARRGGDDAEAPPMRAVGDDR